MIVVFFIEYNVINLKKRCFLKVNFLMNEDMIKIIRSGFSVLYYLKYIIVVGVGLVGFVLVFLLKYVGYRVMIFEVSGRVGGCVCMLRFFFSDGLYFNVGLMCILNIYLLILEYIKKFRLLINVFINRILMDIIYMNGIKICFYFFE